MNSPIILAVDTDNLDTAKSWVASTTPYVGFFKLGLEFFLKFGIEGVAQILKETDRKIFLDLKLHDIPNTVGSAAQQVLSISPEFLTVHASGGPAMIAAAVKALPDTKITAVTILTSLDQRDLEAIGYIGTPSERASALALLAVDAGAKAIVSSPHEIQTIRAAIGKRALIITPGVRPNLNLESSQSSQQSNSSDDQKRTMDPKSALSAGADYLVIGRPITASKDVVTAAKSILEEALA